MTPPLVADSAVIAVMGTVLIPGSSRYYFLLVFVLWKTNILTSLYFSYLIFFKKL